MTATIARLKSGPEFTGRYKKSLITFTGDADYPSGGYTDLTGPEVGARPGSIIGVSKIGGNAASANYGINWDTVNEKLQFAAGGGDQVYAPGGGDIKGATNPAGTEGNADQVAAPVNDALFLARTTFTTLAGTMTPTVQPDVPRNIVITITNDSGGALDLFEGVTTFLITGTNKDGEAQTESVTLTSTAGNKSVATARFRYVQGVKPFKTVTSVAITNAPAATLKGSLGPGTRLGLPAPLATPAVADVNQITVNAAAIAPSATTTVAGGVDTTNSAVNTGTTADGADVSIAFTASGAVPTGADLSGVTVTLEVTTK
jgi:hypothetical protein